jgi:hypothetical protein
MSLPELNRNKAGGWVLLAGAAFCAVMFVREGLAVAYAVRAKSWSVVTGTVVESRAVSGCGTAGGSYYPLVRYTYKFNSQTFEGRRISFGNFGCGSERDAQATASTYAQGQSIPIWVSPSSPTEATLTVGNVGPESWFGLLMMLVFGVGSYLAGRSLLRQ